MTKDNWLTVAMVIAVIITAMATLLGPVLAVYVQSRISQPKPTPDENQPKDTKSQTRLDRFVISRVTAYIWLSMTAASLGWLAFRPVSRSNVFLIAFAFA